MDRQQQDGDEGGRGSRELWLGAAYAALVDAGVEAVRIQPLGRRLKLSRTSFYWFFKDREALLDALLERWRVKNTGSLVRQAEAYAAGIAEALLNINDCWLDPALFDADFEFAVRSWALQSPAVAAEIAQADACRLQALEAMFRRHGYDPLAADTRSRAVYLTQIGYISMKTREPLDARLARIPAYVEVFAGVPPRPEEMARFRARHALRAPGG